MTLVISLEAVDVLVVFFSFLFSFIDHFLLPVLSRLVEISAALDLRVVDLLVNGVVLQQMFMGVKGIDPSIIQYKDPVSRLDA